jgi:hypothetical protein
MVPEIRRACLQTGLLSAGRCAVQADVRALSGRALAPDLTKRLGFFGELVALADVAFFKKWLTQLRQCEWVVYAKRPFAGPEAVLAYLSRSRIASPSPIAD